MKKLLLVFLFVFTLNCVPQKADAGSSYNSDFGWLSNTWLAPYDLCGYSASQLRIFRNAIYAKYGYKFKSDDLRYYFNGFSWYYGKISSESAVAKKMTKTEKHNIEVIRKVEKYGCY